jgi:hypothetical protein
MVMAAGGVLLAGRTVRRWDFKNGDGSSGWLDSVQGWGSRVRARPASIPFRWLHSFLWLIGSCSIHVLRLEIVAGCFQKNLYLSQIYFVLIMIDVGWVAYLIYMEAIGPNLLKLASSSPIVD